MVAPTAAVITAALPVAFTLLTEGRPRLAQLAGFLVALAGIWLVAAGSASIDFSRAGFRLALLAGAGFGGFLILIAQVPPGPVFTPLVIMRGVMLVAALGLLLARRATVPSLTSNPAALLAGMMDAGGNVCYVLAKAYTRLDVAAVLSSLYPVTTVLLAHVIMKEQVSRLQWLGMGICLLAVVLITI
jgi:drug/metabolite transporter (DMT)-like permease